MAETNSQKHINKGVFQKSGMENPIVSPLPAVKELKRESVSYKINLYLIEEI
jgi:hypothetical protein